MRKLLITFCGVISMAVSVYAQDESSSGSSSGGKIGDGVTIEVTGSPFTSYRLIEPGYFRARYFLSEGMAVRLGLWGSVDDNQIAPESVQSTWYASFRPGFEYRFAGNDKITPYAAADVVFDMRKSKFESFNQPAIDGAFNTSGSNRGYWQAGLYLASGFDYHINSHFYVGMEVGFQYAMRKNAEILVDGNSFEAATKVNTFNTVFNNTLRVGFKLF